MTTSNKKTGAANTNETSGSIARLQHSEPTITLMGRVAGGVFGNVGLVGAGRKQDLHFTIIIDDAYTGIFGFDGQPDAPPPEAKPSINAVLVDSMFPAFGVVQGRLKPNLKIKTNYYRNTLPAGIVLQIIIDPPAGMAVSTFASKLIAKACGFANHKIDYSLPSGVIGITMVDGEYNSSSYISGLLNSVLGHVPVIHTGNYQAPGWDSPIPAKYYKDASCS